MDVNLPVLEEGLRWRMCRAVRVDGKECAWAWPRVGWREERFLNKRSIRSVGFPGLRFIRIIFGASLKCRSEPL